LWASNGVVSSPAGIDANAPSVKLETHAMRVFLEQPAMMPAVQSGQLGRTSSAMSNTEQKDDADGTEALE